MRRRSKILMASSLIASPAILTAAYVNTLTRLIPDLYAGALIVSRELVGFVPSVFRNVTAERAAVGQPVVYLKPVAQSAVNFTPAMAIPEPGDKSIGNGFIVLNRQRAVEFGWTGEEQRGLNNGAGVASVQALWFAEALRTLVNEMETDLAVEAYKNASRATGTAGTTPFTGDQIADSAQLRKILDDNGAPQYGRTMIIDTSAGAMLRTVKNLTRANEAGSQMTLRDGELLNLHGFSIKETGAGASMYQTAGTAAGATTNAAGYAVGSTLITLAAAGTGTILQNDTIGFAGDSNRYQIVNWRDDAGTVSGGDTNVADGGTIQIAAPGLRRAVPASATAITITASHQVNVGFSADALHLVARAPAIPAEGDARLDSIMITDSRSGMSFEVSLWKGYRKIRLEVAAVWGVKAVDPTHIAALIG